MPTEAGLPLVVDVLGDPDVLTETFMDAEGGYRLEIGTTAGFSATAFVGRYDRLHTQEPSAPVVEFVPAPQLRVTTTFANLLQASTGGLEAGGYWSPAPAWRLDGSYTALRVTPRQSALSSDPDAGLSAGSAPRRQWQLRAAFSPGSRSTLGAAIFYVGALRGLQVPAYTRADVSAEWRFSDRLSAVALGQNLLDPAHPEFSSAGALSLATEVPRSLSLRMRWTFK
jgi:iron complex outermembrane receptor protein